MLLMFSSLLVILFLANFFRCLCLLFKYFLVFEILSVTAATVGEANCHAAKTICGGETLRERVYFTGRS